MRLRSLPKVQRWNFYLTKSKRWDNATRRRMLSSRAKAAKIKRLRKRRHLKRLKKKA